MRRYLPVCAFFVELGHARPEYKTQRAAECAVFLSEESNAAPFLGSDDEDTPAIYTAFINSRLFLKSRWKSCRQLQSVRTREWLWDVSERYQDSGNANAFFKTTKYLSGYLTNWELNQNQRSVLAR
jgi:hypothetical protein